MVGVFNPQLPSVLSPERIDQINQLAKQANINANSNEIHIHDLIIETCAIEDVLEELIEVGTNREFYENINSAFELLIKDKPENASCVFKTYKELSWMLRVIEREKAVINQKWQEAAKLLADIDTLDQEDRERRKGGESCVS